MLSIIRRLITVSLIWIISSSALVQAAPPSVGVCETDGDNILGVSSVGWSNGSATVTQWGGEVSGRLVGLRQHGERGFKLSIIFQGKHVSLYEAVVFELPTEASTREYRLGLVSYDTLPNGERAVGAISGFETVLCAVLR